MLAHVVRATLAVVLMSLALVASRAYAQDFYSDIWWGGSDESGWGVTLTENDYIIFATLFVHGPAPSTTEVWYVATLNYNAASNAFTGDLYQTNGTGIGAAWDPVQFKATKVGTASFTPRSATVGLFTYNVGATAVAKTITRQTLTTIALGGTYTGTAVITRSVCADLSKNETVVSDFDAKVSQTGQNLRFDFLLSGTQSCTLSGTYVQEGMLFRVQLGSYTCTSGGTTTLDTNIRIYEVKSTNLGLEGRWYASNVHGCREDGKFSAVF